MTKKKAMRKPPRQEVIGDEGTPDYWRQCWIGFLEGFKKDAQANILMARGFGYSHYGFYVNLIAGMVRNPIPKLEVDYNDLVMWIAFEHTEANKLPLLLRDNPDLAIETLTAAARNIVWRLKPDYVDGNDNFRNFHVAIKNYEVKKEIPEIDVHAVGKFLQIEGFVVQIDNRRPYIARAGFRCNKDEQHITYVNASNFQVLRPVGCELCEGRRVTQVLEESTYIDIQRIKVQQRQDRSLPGKIPEPIELVITNPTLIDRVKAGDYCRVTGIIKVLQKTDSLSRNAIAGFYMEANYIERKEDEYLIEVDSDLEYRIKNFIDPADEEGSIEKLILSVSPGLYGAYSLKKAMLAQCAGSDSLKTGATRFRGEIQLGVFGPPSSGKTTAGEWAVQIAPRFMWISPLVTDVGLTASVSNVDGVARLDAGAYLIASSPLGGLVVADEIQNYDEKALRVFAGVMDDRQKININKHGITAELQVNAGTLVMGNPQSTDGIWNRSLNLVENTRLPTWFISRLDLCFIEDDIVEADIDAAKISHINAQFKTAIPEYEIREKQLAGDDEGLRRQRMSIRQYVDGQEIYNEVEMRAFISYIRTTFHPVVTQEALQKLETYYIKLRRDHAAMQKSTGTTLKRPTLRDYGSLIRIARAHARLCCRNQVLARDAEWAVTLMMESIESAGFNPLTGQLVNSRLVVSEPSPSTYDNRQDEEDEDDRFHEGMMTVKTKRLRQIKRKAIRILQKEGTKDCTSCRGRGCGECNNRGMYAELIGEYDISKLWKDKGIDEAHTRGMWKELVDRHFVKLDPRNGLNGYFRLTTDGLRLVVASEDDDLYVDFYDIYNDDKVDADINFSSAARMMSKASKIADEWKSGTL